MGMVSRTESEKMEIADYADDHTINATKEKFGCHPDTARKYHKKYGGSAKQGGDPATTEFATVAAILENESCKLRAENEKLRNIIIDKMLED